MKRSVWIVNPTVNNSCFIIALVAISVLVTEGNVSGNVSISECPQSGGQAQRHIPDDGQPVNFTCENIPINGAVQWVLRTNSNVTKISLKCDSPSQPCNTNNTDFQMSRRNETSVLTVVHNHHKWLVTGTVVCSVGDGNSNVYTCNVKFASTAVTTHGTATIGSTSISSTTPQTPTGVPTSTDGEGNEEKDDGLPIAAISDGVAAFLAIIIIVIVVVVVVRRRKRQKKAHADNNGRSQRSDKTKQSAAVETEVHENSAVADEYCNDASARSPYASLQMSEVGLRSVYSDFAHRSTATQAQPAHPSDYASLQMSDVGMTPMYFELGQHDGVAPSNDGTDYEVPP